MLDIDGLSLTPADRDLLREPAVGGVILFTRNYESPQQVIDLVRRGAHFDHRIYQAGGAYYLLDHFAGAGGDNPGSQVRRV